MLFSCCRTIFDGKTTLQTYVSFVTFFLVDNETCYLSMKIETIVDPISAPAMVTNPGDDDDDDDDDPILFDRDGMRSAARWRRSIPDGPLSCASLDRDCNA